MRRRTRRTICEEEGVMEKKKTKINCEEEEEE